MASVSFKEINLQLDKRIFQPVYFLTGEEAYFIDQIVDRIESEVLNETEKAFNQVVMYGKEVNFKEILDHVRQFPVMSEKKVVIVKEAQGLSDLEMLESYLKNPAEQTVFVLSYKFRKLDGRKSISKIIRSNTTYFESKKLYEDQIPSWIRDLVREKGYRLEDGAAQRLADFLGSDLNKICNEIDKLTLSLQKGTTISLDDIGEKIGISKEYSVFELQKHVGARNTKKVAEVLKYMLGNMKNNPFIYINGLLFSYFTRIAIAKSNPGISDADLARKLKIGSPRFMSEYKRAARNFSISQIRSVFQLLKEYDGRSKGINNRSVNDVSLLKELVFKILTAK